MWTWKLGLGSRTGVVWSLLCLHCGLIQPVVICWEQFYFTRPCIYMIIHIYIYIYIYMYMLCPVTLWLSWQVSKDFDEAQLELQKCVAWRSNSFELREPPDYLLFFKERSRKCQTSQQSTSAKALPMESNWFTKLSLQASMAAFARVVYWEAERSEKLHGPPKIVGSLDSGCRLGEALHIDFGCCKSP